MTITIAAVYEQGSLKLLQPLPLAEGTHVEVTVVPVDAQSGHKTPGAILAEIAAMPLEGSREAFSGRNHNQILYPQQNEKA